MSWDFAKPMISWEFFKMAIFLFGTIWHCFLKQMISSIIKTFFQRINMFILNGLIDIRHSMDNPAAHMLSWDSTLSKLGFYSYFLGQHYSKAQFSWSPPIDHLYCLAQHRYWLSGGFSDICLSFISTKSKINTISCVSLTLILVLLYYLEKLYILINWN